MRKKLLMGLVLTAMLYIWNRYPMAAAAQTAALEAAAPVSGNAFSGEITDASVSSDQEREEDTEEQPAGLDETTDAGFIWKKTADGTGAILTGYNGTDTALVIPDKVAPAGGGEGSAELPVVEIAKMAFIGNHTVVSVDFSQASKLTAIGAYAFQGCTKLETITWSADSVTVIGEKSFAECTALTVLTLPEGLTTLNSQAFAGCSSLKEVTIPATLTGATDRPFYEDNALRTVHFGADIREIAGRTDVGTGGLFTGTGLTAIEIPASVERIGPEAFSLCAHLSSVTFTDKSAGGHLARIEANAFSGCTSLTAVKLPEGLSLLGLKAFAGCAGLTDVEIPASLGAYSNCPFYGDTALKNVTLKPGLTAISGHYYNDFGVEYGGLFAYSGIEELTIPDSVTKIGEQAFHECTALTTLHWPASDSVTEIDEGAFYGCSALSEMTIPKSVTTIGENAFENCTGLLRVEFSVDELYTSEQTLGKAAFRGCAALQEVMLGNRIKKIRQHTFSGNTALAEITIPYGVTEIEANAFAGCMSLAAVFIPASVTGIGTGEDEFSRGNKHTVIYVEADAESTARTMADARDRWDAVDGIWGLELFFPDRKLRNAIQTRNLDADLDSRLTLREVEGLKSLSLAGREIENAAGLQLFTGLTELDISNNMLSSLDVDGESILRYFPDLTSLTCTNNRLTALDLSGNKALTKLYCADNRISVLALSDNRALEELDCSGNALFALDLTANNKLTKPVLGSQSGAGRVADTDGGGKRLALHAVYGAQYTETAVSGVTDDYPSSGEGEAPLVEVAGITWQAPWQVPDRLYYTYRVYYGRGWDEMPVAVELENAGISPDAEEFKAAYPDGNFSHRLVMLADDNGNGLISRTEERKLKSLPLNNAHITTLQGIERLWSLEELNAAGNILTELDLTGNPELVSVDLTGNRLTSLDLSKHTKLKNLSVDGNYLAVVGLSIPSSLTSFTGGKQKMIQVKGSLNESASALMVDMKRYDPLWDGENVLSAAAQDENGQLLTGTVTPTSTGFATPLEAKIITYTWGTEAGSMAVTAAVGDVSVPENMEISFLSSEGETLCDPVFRTKGQAVGELPEPASRAGYRFVGWYTGMDGTGERVDATTILTDQYILFAWFKKIEEGELNYDPVDPVIYTGEALRPAIHIYDGVRELALGKDYSVKYSNNTNAGLALITVTGRGQYRGSTLIRFTILPKPLTDVDVLVWEDELTMLADGGFKTPSPKVTWRRRTLRKETEYTVSYPDNGDGAYRAVGEHIVRLVGRGNFCGERDVHLTLVDPSAGKTLINRAQVRGIADRLYTGDPVELRPTSVVVGKRLLFEGTNYRLEYVNNNAVGVAAVRVVGIKDCAGSKLVPFALKGTSMKRTVVTGLTTQIYDGKEQQPVPVVRVRDELTPLRPGVDYEVSYTNNIDKGTARVTITGKGRMTDAITQTFRIVAYDIGNDADKRMMVNGAGNGALDLTGAWERCGARPEFSVSMGSLPLEAGVDYRVRYTNNNKIGNIGTAVYSGLGNYTGRLTVQFRVVQGTLQTTTASAADIVYNGRKGRWRSVPAFLDSTGIRLKAGTHYDRNLTYEYTVVPKGAGITAGAVPRKTDLVPPGTVISVTATGRGGYAGSTAVVSYRIVSANISRAAIVMREQEWNGGTFTLEGLIAKGADPASLFTKPPTVRINGLVQPISYGTDFVVVPDSYQKNTRTGTASVTLRGISDRLGGTRTVQFKLGYRRLEQTKITQ